MKKLYGVIGDPIAHSLSPLIHKGWMRDYGLPADYMALQIANGELVQGLDTLARKGFKGLNVTLPHKIGALKYAAEVTDRAAKIGAANTLWREDDGVWHADNTDAPGFLASLERFLDSPLQGQTVLVLGAGGSARGIVYALDGAGANILLANRTVSKAEDILSQYSDRPHKALSFSDGLNFSNQADFVVNTTSLGYSGQGLGLPAGGGKLLYDISYGKIARAVLGPAEAKGWRSADGLPMLVYQAAFAFERWFDIMPDIDKGLARCQAVLEAV